MRLNKGLERAVRQNKGLKGAVPLNKGLERVRCLNKALGRACPQKEVIMVKPLNTGLY